MRSLDTIKFLINADKTRRSLVSKDICSSLLQYSVWRGEMEVTKYLLSLPECRKNLVPKEVATAAPLYYASRDYVKDGSISRFLQLFIEASSDDLSAQLGETCCCCLYFSLLRCVDHMKLHDSENLLKIARRDQMYCTRHDFNEKAQVARIPAVVPVSATIATEEEEIGRIEARTAAIKTSTAALIEDETSGGHCRKKAKRF
jgi:hypothetical protein